MSDRNGSNGLERIETGISGFDAISQGGLPKGRTTLVSGTTGSGKTIFACQFLVEGIRRGQNGVFVTFEEPPEMIRRNMLGFGWDIQKWEEEGKWLFVDASPNNPNLPFVSGEFDLDPLLARLDYAIGQVNAQRVSMDSLGPIFTYISDVTQVRSILFKIAVALREREITAILSSERQDNYGDISRYGIEEFVSDNVVLLRNVLTQKRRHRSIEILKFRGSSYQEGEFPFTILSNEGIVVIPLSTDALQKQAPNTRMTSGNAELDVMCGGGFLKNSIILVSGATGTGKTLTATEFIAAGCKNEERCLIFAFEESREQIIRNAVNWSADFAQMERQGILKIICRYPEATGLNTHFVEMREEIKKFQPQRVALDSVSALERITSEKEFREFLLSFNSMLKEQGITPLFTANTDTLTGSVSVTQSDISTNTDMIILLRYVEVYGEIRRGLAVLKMRGSMHNKEIREFTIDDQGMHIERPFRNVSGILAGNPTSSSQSEFERLSELLEDE